MVDFVSISARDQLPGDAKDSEVSFICPNTEKNVLNKVMIYSINLKNFL